MPADRDTSSIEAGELTIRRHSDGETQTIELHGELDLASSEALENELRIAEGRDGGTILLDLSSLAFMDSTGIRIIVAAAERGRANGDRLRLLRGSGQIERVLKLTRLDGTLPFAD